MSSAVPLVLPSFWLLLACSAGNPPVAHSETDPSNARAPAGPPLVLAATSTGAPAAALHGHEAHPDHGAHEPGAKGEYTCPMHPEVVASGPGQCPTCHMDLVPKTAVEN